MWHFPNSLSKTIRVASLNGSFLVSWSFFTLLPHSFVHPHYHQRQHTSLNSILYRKQAWVFLCCRHHHQIQEDILRRWSCRVVLYPNWQSLFWLSREVMVRSDESRVFEMCLWHIHAEIRDNGKLSLILNKTFAPVAKMTTLQMVLALVAQKGGIFTKWM